VKLIKNKNGEVDMSNKPESWRKGMGIVTKKCKIGEGTVVWHYANLYGCKIGKNCRIGSFVEIQRGVKIGDNCKIECGAYIPSGVTIGNNVLVGPHAVFTNDLYPKAAGEWQIVPTIVEDGASIGANTTIRCGVTIGKNALIGCGAVVTKSVPKGEIWTGNPASKMRKKL